MDHIEYLEGLLRETVVESCYYVLVELITFL